MPNPSPVPGRRFPKGKSGNPKGRPKKGESITELIAQLGSVEDVKLPDGTKVSRRAAVAERLWQKAIREGDTTAIKFIIERIEGKTPQVIQGPDDEDGKPTPAAVVMVIQKRSISEWQQQYNQSSGSPSQDKPKRSPARRLSSSSAARKAEGKATSSSETT